MQITVRSNEQQREEFISKIIPDEIKIIWLMQEDILNETQADVYFDLLFDETDISKNNLIADKPVFANAVITTCKELPPNYIRINAWSGFLERDLSEVCANEKIKVDVAKILETLQWKYEFCEDEPGMVAARIISMIINEAYYVLEDEVSTKEQIDIAMKLGTNYPYGPFEWSEKIGLKNIYLLLKKLNKQETRYTISALLEKEV